MPGRSRTRPAPLPLMFAQLAASSWTTILHRSLMIAQGTCTAAEYQRMVAEKIAAAQLSAAALVAGKGARAALSPYLTRARANHRRLAARPPASRKP